MAYSDNLRLFVALVVSCFSVVLGGDFCRKSRYVGYETTYCSYGCCGSYANQYCCSGGVGGIVGGILGSLFFIALAIVLICCCCRRMRGNQGTVVRGVGAPGGLTGPGVVVVSNTSAAYPSANAYGQPMGVQPNGQNANYQPMAGQYPPAYNYGQPMGSQPAGQYPSNQPMAAGQYPPQPMAAGQYPPQPMGAGQYPPNAYSQPVAAGFVNPPAYSPPETAAEKGPAL